MSLTPADQRALHEIESQLSRSDSALVAMFTLLDADTQKSPGGQVPSRRGPTPASRARVVRLLMIPLLAVVAALLVVGITVAVTAATHGSWSGKTAGTRQDHGSPEAPALDAL